MVKLNAVTMFCGIWCLFHYTRFNYTLKLTLSRCDKYLWRVRSLDTLWLLQSSIVKSTTLRINHSSVMNSGAICKNRNLPVYSDTRPPPCLQLAELNLDNCKSPTIDGLTDKFSNLEALSLNSAGLTTLKGFPALPKLRKVGVAAGGAVD